MAALTGVALVAVMALGAFFGASSTATELTPRVERALISAGLEDVALQVHGREVTVRNGTVDELAAALGASEGVAGVRAAEIDPRPGSVDRIDMTRAYLKLRRDPDRLRILGAVPDAAAAATVKASAARAFGVPVRGDLTIDSTLAAVDWTDELTDAFDELTDVTDMELTVDGDLLKLSGSVGAGDERRSLLREIALSVPSLTVASDVQVGTVGS